MEPVAAKVVPKKTPFFSLILKPSRWLAGYLTLLHLLLLAAALLVLADTVVGFIVFTLLLVMHWLYSLWRFSAAFAFSFYSYPRPCVDRIWRVTFRDHCWLLSQVDKELAVDLVQATVWSWLVVMNFRCRSTGRRYAVAVLADSADPDCRRALRVLLRHLPVWGTPPDSGVS